MEFRLMEKEQQEQLEEAIPIQKVLNAIGVLPWRSQVKENITNRNILKDTIMSDLIILIASDHKTLFGKNTTQVGQDGLRNVDFETNVLHNSKVGVRKAEDSDKVITPGHMGAVSMPKVKPHKYLTRNMGRSRRSGRIRQLRRLLNALRASADFLPPAGYYADLLDDFDRLTGHPLELECKVVYEKLKDVTTGDVVPEKHKKATPKEHSSDPQGNLSEAIMDDQTGPFTHIFSVTIPEVTHDSPPIEEQRGSTLRRPHGLTPWYPHKNTDSIQGQNTQVYFDLLKQATESDVNVFTQCFYYYTQRYRRCSTNH
ncbi:hypothetical protein RF55_11081 [Lasius niger]|uniref:Uncharacterized protein n=1 Tax=Lasius niger TaxID=67767 RepID=A0A0J7KGG5_LASNI|nr:hypothetical protein RF55_11081 [Lasius niger]